MFRGEQPATCLQIISDDFQDHESSGHINLKQGTSAEIHEQHVSSNQTAFANEQSSSSSNQSIVIEQQIPQSSNCTTVLEELDTSLQDHEGNNVDNVFYCPEYGCTKAYQSFEKMQDHILIGKHSKQLLNDSTYDRAKKIWAEKCENLHASTHVTIESDPGTSSSNNFNIPAMGWALKKEKKYVRFSQNVKSYLTELFKIGEASGKKENPAAVAMNMRGRECADLSITNDGVYTIYPNGNNQAIQVYCVVRQGFKWTVIQRRVNGSVDFYRTWNEYKHGFGSAYGEYWLGNNYINLISTNGRHELSIYMERTDVGHHTANYSTFKVSDEQSLYILTATGYSGDANPDCIDNGDDNSKANGRPFTTKDRDNDIYSGNMAVKYRSAWWYSKK
ncbi:angiopoietin-2-like [Mytilus californianus]|uniref:angiopoietin-2-like n=1 Tax=Mytilus californianus TaxID=6549 RepID=UPI0022476F70|nr:angiopoietin-2-like [Mytilus californianus]